MLLVNQILNNRYRIVRQLGRGGMGAVYEAQDNVFETTCAIKEIMIDMEKAPSAHQQEVIKAAFEREAKLLAKIKHEVVPHVRDYFAQEDRQFLVMELVEGKDLGELMEQRKGPFPVEDVVRWLEQLLDGLDYLHTQNPPIYHRDIKPQNLKLTPRGKIKLLDFGIAKGGAEVKNSTVGNQTFIAATLNYSPIEQTFRVLDPVFREVLAQRFETQIRLIADQAADARTDIYALGATAYHLMTGHLPIDSLKRVTEMWSGKTDPLADPLKLNNRIPPEIGRFLLKSMEVDRDNRYSSALEMEQALGEAVIAMRSRPTAPAAEQPATVWQAAPTEPDVSSPSSENPKDAATLQISADRISGQLQQPAISEQTIAAQSTPPPVPSAANPSSAGSGQLPPPNQFAGQAPPVPTPFGAASTPPASPFATGQQAPPPGNPFATGQPPPPGNPFATGQPQTAAYGFAGAANTGGQQTAPNTGQGGFSVPVGGQSNTGGAAFVSAPYSPPDAAKGKKSGKLWLILIPVVALLFLVVGAVGIGIVVLRQTDVTTPSPTPTPAGSPTPAATSPTPSPTENVKSASPTPTPSVSPSPTAEKTLVPSTPATKTPPPVKVPKTPTKPKPKNSDCIFTGDC